MAAIGGIAAAAVTPRREGPEIDLAATFELIDFLGSSGVASISLLGFTGEFVHFTPEDRSRLISLAVKRSKRPVIAGVAHSTLDGAVALGRDAAEAGAVALLLMPPYLYRYRQEDIREFYLCFARELEGAAPILLYNAPAPAAAIAPETAIELLQCGAFTGIKDSSGDWDQFERLRAARDGTRFTLLVGTESLYLRARQAGADGAISGVACAVPELMVALDAAITGANAEKALRLDARLREFLDWAGDFPPPVLLREALAARGLRVGPPASPPGPQGRARLAEFNQWFRGWLPAIRKECA
jgi:4-hydroxy-tetrahydrodipicolinate synthase